MSYILEALKKSEQERKQGQVPDISSLHGESLSPAPRKMTVKILAAISLVSVIALIVVLAIGDHGAIEIPPPPRPPLTKPTAAVNFTPPDLRENTVTEGITAKATPAGIALPPDRTPSGIVPEKKGSGVTRLADLPASIRDHLPSLVISAHFYADNPDSRMASVNGHLLRQGDEVEPGITVHEITPEGVVFEADGRAILVPVY